MESFESETKKKAIDTIVRKEPRERQKGVEMEQRKKYILLYSVEIWRRLSEDQRVFIRRIS